MKGTFLLVLLFSVSPAMLLAQCNGHQQLCGKRYNEVAYATTHDAFNAEEEGFNLPNQTYGLTRQLNDGIRALMLDVYDENGVATVYHGLALLGTATLESNLNEVKEFLEANPNEVVTLIFETYIPAAMMDTVLTQVGVKPLLYAHQPGIPWPTLQELIDANKRLVLFSDHDNGQPGQDWYHYMWELMVETDFDNSSLNDFSCAFNRGDPVNDLFILNHFATDPTFGTGRTDLAQQANAFDFFYQRALMCWQQTGKFPNFLTVDFYELGDVFEVTDSLNRVSTALAVEQLHRTDRTGIAPNPSTGRFRFSWKTDAVRHVEVYDAIGSRLFGRHVMQGSFELDLTAFTPGVYYVTVRNNNALHMHRLVHLGTQ